MPATQPYPLNLTQQRYSQQTGYDLTQAKQSMQPMVFNFVAQMQPDKGPGTLQPMPPDPYGLIVNETYGANQAMTTGQDGHNGHQGLPPGGMHLGDLPPELAAFREACAAGVRQAVGMVTALEHQLAWERARRQQVRMF